MISKISRSSVLTIESIRDYHAGPYTCFGKNAAGVANYSVALVVNGSNDIHSKQFVCFYFTFLLFRFSLYF